MFCLSDDFFVVDYRSGIQLRDGDNNVLINLNLPNGEMRFKMMDWLYASMEETKELNRLDVFKKKNPPITPGAA